MRVSAPARLLQLLHTGTQVAVSMLLVCAVGAVLPGPAAWVLAVGMPAVAVCLLCGPAEPLAARVFAGARQPGQLQVVKMAPAFAIVRERGLGTTDLEVLVGGRLATVQVGAFGKGTVLVSAGFTRACAAQELPAGEAAALLAHAIGRLRLRQTRFEAALAWYCLPWRMLRAVARRGARVAARWPAILLVWRVRFLVAVVALVQTAADGHPGAGVVAAGSVALSYLMPWWEGRWEQLCENAADRFVADAGLAAPLTSFLARRDAPRRRMQHLEALRGRHPSRPPRPIVTVRP